MSDIMLERLWLALLDTITMVGVSGGFVHGVGFEPYNRFWRLLFGPLCAWPLMLLGYAILWSVQV